MAQDSLQDWFTGRGAAPSAPDHADGTPWEDDARPAQPPWWEEEAPARPRLSRVLLVAAGAVWILVTVLVVVFALGADPPPEQTAPVLPATPPAGGIPVGPSQPPRLTPAPSSEAGHDNLRSAAALHVRTTLTSDDEPLRYVDAVVPERVTELDQLAVVTVAAVVLAGDTGGWTSATPQRFGVALDPQGRPLGMPWPLPEPAVGADDPEWADLDDPALASAVGELLSEAGYRDIADLTLARAADLPGVLQATLTARGPGAPTAQTWQPLLADEDPPRLLGTAGTGEP